MKWKLIIIIGIGVLVSIVGVFIMGEKQVTINLLGEEKTEVIMGSTGGGMYEGYRITKDFIPYNQDGYDLQSEGTTYSFYIKNNSNYGEIMKFCVNQTNCIIYNPSDISYRDQYKSQDYISNVQSIEGVTGRGTFTYQDILPNTDLEYTLLKTTVKESYILKSKLREPAEYLGEEISLDYGGYINFGDLSVFVDGENKTGEDFLTNEKIDFIDSYGNEAFHLPKPVAIDSINSSINLSYEVYHQGQQIWFYIKVPYTWLNDSQRVYPIIIDPTLYEYYNTGDNSYNNLFTYYIAQSFTVGTVGADEEFVIKNVSALMLLYGAGSRTLNVTLRAANVSGLPTGALLSEGTFTGVNTTKMWFNTTMSPYTLQPSTQYVLTFKSDGDAAHFIELFQDASSPTYTGGNESYSTNGIDWNNGDWDAQFEVWGGGSSLNWKDNSTNSTIAGESVLHNVFWESYNGLSTYTFSYCNGSYELGGGSGGGGTWKEDWEDGNFNGWSNSNWAIESSPARGSYSAGCLSELTCHMYSTTAMDTSDADIINVSFWINDDDNEPGDTAWYVNLSDNTWETRSNIDGGSLCGDDTWCYFSVLLDGAIYRHPGFTVRYLLSPNKNENYWIDDINVTWNETSSPPTQEDCLDANPTFTNYTTVGLSGTINWSNVTMITNSTIGSTIKWQVYANDTSNNWNSTGIFAYNTTEGGAEGDCWLNGGLNPSAGQMGVIPAGCMYSKLT